MSIFSRKITDLEWREWQIKATIQFIEVVLLPMAHNPKFIKEMLEIKIADLKMPNPNPVI